MNNEFLYKKKEFFLYLFICFPLKIWRILQAEENLKMISKELSIAQENTRIEKEQTANLKSVVSMLFYWCCIQYLIITF